MKLFISIFASLLGLSAYAFPGQPKQISIFASPASLYSVELPNIDQAGLVVPEEKCSQTCTKTVRFKSSGQTITIGENDYTLEFFTGHFDPSGNLVVDDEHSSFITIKEQVTQTRMAIALSGGSMTCVGSGQRLCTKYSLDSTH